MQLIQLWHFTTKLALGHAMAMTLLFGVPLACFIRLRRIPAGSDRSAASERQRLMVFSMSVLMVLLTITICFSASVPDGNPWQALQRLHMRYYGFALPLCWLVAGAWTRDDATSGRGGMWRFFATIVLLGFYVYAWHDGLHAFTPNRIDSPEIHGVIVDGPLFGFIATLGFACLLMWLISRRFGALLYALLFVPVFTLGASVNVNREAAQRRVPDAYDRAARTVHDLLPADQRKGIVVFGDNIFSLFQSNFALDSADTRDVALTSDRSITTADFPDGARWALVIGQHAMQAPTESAQHFDGYTLYRLIAPIFIDFRHDHGTLLSSKGLSDIEHFGRWSNADVVSLKLSQPIPASVELRLTAAAFGPNVGKAFDVSLGDERLSFKLGDAAQTVVLRFHNPPGLDTLQINVPMPTSPQSLGQSVDARRLGIALSSLELVPAGADR